MLGLEKVTELGQLSEEEKEHGLVVLKVVE
jgi:hypothetical protein